MQTSLNITSLTSPKSHPFGSQAVTLLVASKPRHCIQRRVFSSAAYRSDSYRHGFNGKEEDYETFEGALAFEARILDCRLGRFLSIDFKYKTYPWQSVFAYFKNSPIGIIDYLGLGEKPISENNVPTNPSNSPENIIDDEKDPHFNSWRQFKFWVKNGFKRCDVTENDPDKKLIKIRVKLPDGGNVKIKWGSKCTPSQAVSYGAGSGSLAGSSDANPGVYNNIFTFSGSDYPGGTPTTLGIAQQGIQFNVNFTNAPSWLTSGSTASFEINILFHDNIASVATPGFSDNVANVFRIEEVDPLGNIVGTTLWSNPIAIGTAEGGTPPMPVPMPSSSVNANFTFTPVSANNSIRVTMYTANPGVALDDFTLTLKIKATEAR